MRKKLLVGNWKMNKTIKDAESFIESSKKEVDFALKNQLEIGFAPTYLCLESVRKLLNENALVFAQNVHYENNGAFTGEISPEMLKSVEIDGSIVGHSERRTYDNETSLKCNQKIKSLLKHNLIPLYCVGETEKEFEEGKTKLIISEQLEKGLKDLSDDEAEKVIIAYEPVWSIGTGKSASKEIAQEVCKFIREKIAILNPHASEKIRILYGGSVNAKNVKEYLQQNDIDGALVGGASLKVETFSDMIHALI